jgi:di/tricarboxylate transporter
LKKIELRKHTYSFKSVGMAHQLVGIVALFANWLLSSCLQSTNIQRYPKFPNKSVSS